jgi:outer membrane protein W
MRRVALFVLAAALAMPGVASAQQTVDFLIGGFVAHAPDARPANDVINQDLNFLSFDPTALNGFTIDGEWLFALNNHFEGGLGLGFYQSDVPSTYLNLVNANGAEITQDLKLRVVPFTATVRFLPLGHGAFEPYIGGGVAAYYWRYAETGQFVDQNNNIFNANSVGSGSAVGPVVVGGARFVFDPMTFGGEIRWQSGHGNLPADQGFAGSVIDLGGFNYLFTVGVRF